MGTPEVAVLLLRFVQQIRRKVRGCSTVFGALELLPIIEMSCIVYLKIMIKS
jgi:hypothetical protein